MFIPITVGGGIKSVEQAKRFFKHGVDKIALCSALFEDDNLLSSLSKEFGAQSVIVSIQAMNVNNEWRAFKEMARQNTKIKIADWIKKSIENGAGEPWTAVLTSHCGATQVCSSHHGPCLTPGTLSLPYA